MGRFAGVELDAGIARMFAKDRPPRALSPTDSPLLVKMAPVMRAVYSEIKYVLSLNEPNQLLLSDPIGAVWSKAQTARQILTSKEGDDT
jgi:hypothetical protein